IGMAEFEHVGHESGGHSPGKKKFQWNKKNIGDCRARLRSGCFFSYRLPRVGDRTVKNNT
ncbi:hypothetical protein, partial [Bacillus amyloliquefaciens]|uniref:hypothetical protein n=1 Tax=Bacillus amyloliquefaciens TaxID=1390 RepID=UPI001C12C065